MYEFKNGGLEKDRFRVIVSTDIGGSDPDDFQSMVHYLLYADVFDTEGLISSPWDKGRVSDIYEVIDHYEKDYPKLIQHSATYPKADDLRSITKQGAINIAPYKGYSQPTEGSEWIIKCAKKEDSRPLYILAWGLLEDLAQALHDDPSIISKLRVYYIGGPNKKWGLNAYEYIRENFPELWIIENNSTYRGWFNGGNQNAPYGNETFVQTHIKGHGSLGQFFTEQLGGVIKMGDTPSVVYLLKGQPEVPEKPSWGGQFVKVSSRPKSIIRHKADDHNTVEVFEVIEFCFDGPIRDLPYDEPILHLLVDKQKFEGYYCGNGQYKVRFMPKIIGEWSYTVESEIEAIHGLSGTFTSTAETQSAREHYNNRYPNWWSDILEPSLAVGVHSGAETVAMWREDFLDSFRDRLDRCL